MVLRPPAWTALALALILTGFVTEAQAQRAPAPTQPQKPDPKAPTQPAPPAAPEEPPPPYETEMLRLSEIMGSLAYLRTLCNAPDQSEWRARMAALLEAEATTSTRRERLAGAYNKGFRGYSLTYRRCTSSAVAAIERYLVEGKTLARTISGRFGG